MSEDNKVEVFVNIPVPYVFEATLPYYYKDATDPELITYGRIDKNRAVHILRTSNGYILREDSYRVLKETDLGNYFFDMYESTEAEFKSVLNSLKQSVDNI